MNLIESLRGGLIVSVQAYPGEPMRHPETMAQIARAAEQGGAVAIRCQGLADIAAIKEATGCDLVMIGRGAIGNPWIFSRRDTVDILSPERAAMMRRHLAAMREYYGARLGLLLFRKHSVRYVQFSEGVRFWRRAFGAAGSVEEVLALIDRLEANPEDPPGLDAPEPPAPPTGEDEAPPA